LFWHHHANVDRFWECWTTRNGRDANPTNDKDWMNQSFKFVNEKGEPVEMKVSALFDPAGPIDYTYDNVTQCFRSEPPVLVAAAREAGPKAKAALVTKTEIAAARNVRLDKVDQRVLLNPASAKSSAKDRKQALGFAARPGGASPTKTLLKLSGVEVTGAQPGASVSVFLVNRTGDRQKFVGVISFFGVMEHRRLGHAAGGGRDFSFDVSTQLPELLAGRSTNEEIHVSFVASSGLAGEATGVNQERYQKAGLRVREIKLEVEPAAAPSR
jgi:tyrosinase